MTGLVRLIRTAPTVVARRAAVSLSVTMWLEDALDIMDLLAHDDDNVRLAVLSGFLRVFESVGVRTLLADRTFVTEPVSVKIVARLSADGVDLRQPDLTVAPLLDYISNLGEWPHNQ